MHSNIYPFVYKAYVFDYDGFVARVTFISETEINFEVLFGPAKGSVGNATYSTQQVSETQYLITWQEEDGGTVVHLDDFVKGQSYSHYTNARHEFFVMNGSICEVIA
ncbi:adenylate cyclase [Erwinia sp. S63]|uniref:MoaF-related domain-containing protein n=1 Tax=Erwiniaceae TaxID=1903409 RepID=UPI001909B9E5|nr:MULTISPECIES: hypothetical protein [Erwiniaceae]MBK0094330.1 adenylate cyclase [Erwinia sp. S59]MBK0099687.1 adenylate cyclase [Erwinia sp. S63]MBK0127917.1 adenylate cyclase [Pantoea sp. S61]